MHAIASIISPLITFFTASFKGILIVLMTSVESWFVSVFVSFLARNINWGEFIIEVIGSACPRSVHSFASSPSSSESSLLAEFSGGSFSSTAPPAALIVLLPMAYLNSSIR